ncbi:unnamed protein product [Adineta ricciae]|uniref:Uncharacterized protein n=1 Tax=Adineta ricciae TaxID=249248 RepID=A0A814L2K3_ADIRI|nr:unnamed protein product [Adineta ricciae]
MNHDCARVQQTQFCQHFLVLWHMVNLELPPSSLYLLIINSISVCTALMMMMLFHFSEQVKTSAYDHIKKLWIGY